MIEKNLHFERDIMKTSVFFLLFFFTICTNAAKTIELTPTSLNTPLQIVLPSNPTTGYQWTVKNYNTSLLQFISSQFVDSKQPLIGTGGNTVFIFRILKQTGLPQTTTLHFYYARPWEPKTGTEQIVIIHFPTRA